MDKTRALYLPAAESRRAEDGKGIGAEALHARYLDDVFRYVSRRLPRREEAEDVTAEVFEAALTALPGYRGRAHPYVWLLGIARRKIIDAGRRRRARPETFASEMAGGDDTGRDETEVFVAAGPGPEARVLQAERLETGQRSTARRAAGAICSTRSRSRRTGGFWPSRPTTSP